MTSEGPLLDRAAIERAMRALGEPVPDRARLLLEDLFDESTSSRPND